MQKSFDSLDLQFLIAKLKKYGFRPSFIQWVKTLLYRQESAALLIMDVAQGIFNYLEGHDKVIPCLLIYSFLR